LSFVKSKILNQLAKSYPNYIRRDLEKALNCVFNEIIDALAKGRGCEIRGFGSWRIRHRKKKIGRNPKTGAKIDIPAKKTIHWKMSKDLLNMLNES